MYSGNYLIADHVVGIESVYPYVHDFCAKYKTSREPDFTVVLTNDDIVEERVRSISSAQKEGIPYIESSDAFLESLAAYRNIAERMIQYDIVLFHGSAVAVDGEAYIFAAKSGTGKSTHTALWRKYLGERAVMINDDKPLLHITASCVTVYGTPYNGKHRIGENISAPLKAICILERAEENTICEISKAEAYPMLMQQTYRPRKAEDLAKVLPLVDRLGDIARLYRLGCNMDIDAARVAYEGMNSLR